MAPLSAAMKRRRKAQQTVVKFNYEWKTLAEYLGTLGSGLDFVLLDC